MNFNWLKRIFYALPFGMKGGDNIILDSNTSNNVESKQIVSNINDTKLGKALLNGEITEQVIETRYMDYKVSNESKKYKYIGDGNAIKVNPSKKKNHKLSQDNKIICENVLDELNRVDSYGNERYIISIITNDIPKFKLEHYCTVIDVDINNEIYISLHFSTYCDKYDVTTKAFVNELEKIYNNTNKKYVFQHSEICSNIKQLSFVTHKAYNEDDFISYNFYNLKCFKFDKNEHEYVITYTADYYDRKNLIDKFFSDSMQFKYDTKMEKKSSNNIIDFERKEYCSICNCEMNKYDADITKYTYGKPICVKCLEKNILEDKLI